MKKSKYDEMIIIAHEKGYFVNENGNVYYKGKRRKLYNNTTGYFYFTIRTIVNGKSKSSKVKVHRLQAYQKYGRKIFKNGIQVRHKNGNSHDNSEFNILIGTSSDNHFDIPKRKRIKLAINASKHNRKFSDEEIEAINLDRTNGYTYKRLKEKYNVSKGTLSYIFNKATYNKNGNR